MIYLSIDDENLNKSTDEEILEARQKRLRANFQKAMQAKTNGEQDIPKNLGYAHLIMPILRKQREFGEMDEDEEQRRKPR